MLNSAYTDNLPAESRERILNSSPNLMQQCTILLCGPQENKASHNHVSLHLSTSYINQTKIGIKHDIKFINIKKNMSRAVASSSCLNVVNILESKKT